jgi:hypothetical protein
MILQPIGICLGLEMGTNRVWLGSRIEVSTMTGGTFGGAAEAFNLVAMEKGINRGSFNQFEADMSANINTGSTRFDMSISYSGSSARPTGFDASYRMGRRTITFRGRQ